jgi:hypothetical protein
LKPLTKHIPSFVQNDISFLNHLPENILEDEILATFDVTSLYSKITHDMGHDAIQLWLNKFQSELPGHFTKDVILKAIEIILKNNTFQFNDTNYKQKIGTAMSTKLEPTYATLVLGYLKQNFYTTLEDTKAQHLVVI